MSKDFNITTRKSQSVKDADNIIKEIQAEEKADDKKRINLDMPSYLFDMMEKKLKSKGFSMKGYVVSLIRKDLGDE
jgi:predicted DNA binding CopG/RHH family protein